MKNGVIKRFAMLAILCVLVTVFAVPLASAAGYSKVYGQTQDKVRVRESASTNATVIDNVVKGACVYVTSSKTSGSSTFIQVKYRASDGSIQTGWICQSDGKTTYVKILSATQAKNAFSVSGGDLPSKKVGTFTAAQRKASATSSDSAYIKLGSSGENVKSVQTKLKAMGLYAGEITGNVGEKTEAAIKAFQKKYGLTADGIAGPQTLAKIDAAYASSGASASASSSSGSGLKLGSTGTAVRNLQQDLTALGYYWAEITGNFGSKTETAVKRFQEESGLKADGVAGTKTLNALAAAVEKKGGTSSSSSASGSVLKLNSQGTKVSQLQTDLKQLGYYYADITGNFGEKTEAAVKAFQKAKGLTADGVAGTKTLNAIASAISAAGGSITTRGSGLRLGSSGDNVRNLQTDLTTLGYYSGDITGNFGSLTQQAVKKFQQSRGLTADGIAGTTTINAIASALKSSGSSSASGSTSSTALREGDSGTAVRNLQTDLKSLGYYYGDITGNFGSLTRQAVRKFQDANDLTVDGIAGTATLNKIASVIKGSGGTSASDTGSSSGTTVTTANSYGRITKDNVYLRSSYSTTSAAKASLSKGTLVRISKTYTSGGVKWYYISVTQGRYTYNGYVRSDMMETITEKEYTSAGGSSDNNASDMETIGMIRVTGNNVSLRYEPSTSATRVGTANTGDVFYYVDTVDGWFQTRSGYWISKSYAKVMTDEEIKDYTGSNASGTSYRYDDTSPTVGWIQTALKSLGYYSATISNHFGSKTEAAVKDFQRDHGLTADGVVGPTTMTALQAAYYGTGGGGTATGSYNATIYNLYWPSEYNRVFKNLGFVAGCKKATLTDVETGLTFNIYVQSSGKNHADAEPLTAADTATLCKIYGVSSPGSISWKRHGMVLTVGGEQFVCSVYAQPHGQQDIPNNNFEGQFCIHFRGSQINAGDGGSVPDAENHQAIIKNTVTKLKAKKVTVDGVEKNITVLEDYPTKSGS